MSDPIRLIAIDLDGTLLNSQRRTTPRTERAIQSARDRGIAVCLATGRPFSAAAEVAGHLKLNAPGVYMQGLIIHDADGTIRHQQTMDLALARRLIEFAGGFDAMLMGYSGLGTLTRAEHPQIEKVASHLEPIPKVVGPLENVLDRAGINKFLFVGEVPAIRAIRAALTAHFNGAATIVQAVPDMLEVLPPGASKGAGLKWLIDDLGIPAGQVMALGDGENDVEMLQLAGLGVAMGNANPKAKVAARYVVADHDHDGVGEAIEKFILSSNRR